MRAYDPSRSNKEQQRRVSQAMINKGAVKQVMIKESEIANTEPTPEPVEFIEFRTKSEREAGRQIEVAYQNRVDFYQNFIEKSRIYPQQTTGWTKSDKEMIIR